MDLDLNVNLVRIADIDTTVRKNGRERMLVLWKTTRMQIWKTM